MKRNIILTLFISLVSLCATAQEHIKFMGIPMGGTITAFQNKLQAKGLKVSVESARMPAGQRGYKGTFSGEQAEILIWFNPRTKIVYRGKAMINRYGKEFILGVLSEMESKLDLKYPDAEKYTDTFKDDYSHELRSVAYKLPTGRIDLFITGESYIDSGKFYLHIDYHDAINDFKNTLDEMEDL
ncbi:hypothetical protein HPS54_11865 [Prevotella sp. PCHR]|uniref:Uncharacterized protein n=1 Tax=Xylanibacter caecicola TaxID=2736294 RepID=A0ABX2B806_9BACT|nr:hypothetical protein [Xylanibacter caecicola]NPE26194.1 hypothetical protein [Xylanibacter caecicola]